MEPYVKVLDSASSGEASEVIDLDLYDGFFLSAESDSPTKAGAIIQWAWSRSGDAGSFIPATASNVPFNRFVWKEARYLQFTNSSQASNTETITAYASYRLGTLVDPSEVTITGGTFYGAEGINKIANADVSWTPGSTVGKLPVALFNSDGSEFDFGVTIDNVDITEFAGLAVYAGPMAENGIDITGQFAPTVHGLMYGLYNNTSEILPIGTDAFGSAFDGSYAALFTNNANVAIGNTAIANQGNAPGYMPVALGDTYGNEIDASQIYSGMNNIGGAHALFSMAQNFAFDANGFAGADIYSITAHNGLDINSDVFEAIDHNTQAIGGTAIANQSNAPGWMPSALGDSFGNPVEAGAVGDATISGHYGLNTMSALYDGFGNPIVSAQSTYFSGHLLETALGLYSEDANDYIDVYSAKPGDWFNGLADVGNGPGIVSVTSIDAVGGGAVAPAISTNGILGAGLSPDDDASLIVHSAPLGMDVDNEQGFGQNYLLPTTAHLLPGEGTSDYSSIFAADVLAHQATWGGVALAPATDTNTIVGSGLGPNDDIGPIVHSAPLAMDVDNEQGYGQNYLLPTTAHLLPGEGTSDYSSIFASDVLAHQATWGGGNVASADANGAIPVNSPEAFNTSGVVVAPTVITLGVNKVLQNYTANAVWQGSVGADTFTATLEGSWAGTFTGSDLVVLRTLTESNLKDAIANVPYPYSRINLSALTLDTATGITINGVGSK